MNDLLSRQRLFETLFADRFELLRSLMFVNEHEATSIPIHGDWSVRDVMSHITARECWAFSAIQHLFDDGNPGFRNALSDRQFNLAAVARRRDFSLRDVLDELDGIRRQLTRQAKRIPNRDLYAEFEVINSDQVQSIAGTLKGLAEHDLEHAGGIWLWRAENGLLSRDRFRWIITSQREEFLNSLGGLFENEILSMEVCGHWTVADVMAHVLSWDEEVYRTAENWTRDRSWQAEALYDDDWNEIEVAKRADMDVIALADGLTTMHRKLIQLFDSLSDAELAAMANTPWGERMALISFLYEMVQHDAAHTPDLRALQKRVRV